MTPMSRLSLALALAALLACLAGCSGGSAHGPATAGSRSAPAQVAAALFVQQWSQILWGMVTSQTATGTPSFGSPVLNPDGSVSQPYTGADGTAVLLTVFTDGSAALAVTYPDGSGQTTRQGVPQYLGNKTTTAWEITASDGLAVNYTSVVDNNGTFITMADDTTDLEGSSVLPGNLTQQFTVHSARGQTALQSDQSDGSTFTMTVPLKRPDFAYPDLSQPASGTYRFGGVDSELSLASTVAVPSRWARLSSDLGGGTSGDFRLAADFAGTGQLHQDGSLLALLSWTRSGDMSLSFVAGDRADTDPAGGRGGLSHPPLADAGSPLRPGSRRGSGGVRTGALCRRHDLREGPASRPVREVTRRPPGTATTPSPGLRRAPCGRRALRPGLTSLVPRGARDRTGP